MKKATFLLALFLTLVVGQKQGIYAEEFPFSGFTISLEEQVIDGDQQILITKGGINPFQVNFGMEGVDFYYNDVELYMDYIVVYGYALDSNDERNYNGFILVLTKTGDIVYSNKESLDYGLNETVSNLYNLSGHMVVELEQSRDLGQSVETVKHIFLIYNEDFVLVEEHHIDGAIKEIQLVGDRLLGRTSSGEDFDFGFRSTGDVIYDGENIGVDNGGVYQGEVCMNFLNPVMLNEEILEDYACVDAVGQYTLLMDDYQLQFTIEPIIEGVEDGKTYYETLMIGFNSGYATLNGDNYSSNEEITEIGQYYFVLHGINGYTKELTFEIGSVVKGITNNTVYQEAVTIQFSGQGYINNQYIESPFTVEQPGEYILKIKGLDGYVESYYFEIEEQEESHSLRDFIQKVDVFVLGGVLIVGLVVIKRKK